MDRQDGASESVLADKAPQWQSLEHANKRFDCLRLDLIDPLISGNKSFKLALNLAQAKAQGLEQIISFGGAYSNHLHALAAAGQQLGIRTIGVVRGEPHYRDNPCLSDAQEMGMQLHFVDRKTYARRYEAEYWQQLCGVFGPSYLVPEGGANDLGAKGCQHIAKWINQAYEQAAEIVVASGTATTAAGIASALDQKHRLHVVNVLRVEENFEAQFTQRVLELNPHYAGQFYINNDCHGGGYAKYDAASAALMDFAWHTWQLPLEPIYTAKAFAAAWQLLGNADSDKPVVLLHTGGMQGLRGCAKRLTQLRQKADYDASLARLMDEYSAVCRSSPTNSPIRKDVEEGELCPI